MTILAHFNLVVNGGKLRGVWTKVLAPLIYPVLAGLLGESLPLFTYMYIPVVSEKLDLG